MNTRNVRGRSAIRPAAPVLVATAVATVLWVSAGDLNPPPGAIMPTDRAQLNEQVVTLPHTIVNAGSYVLTSNLIGSSGLDGIIIAAPDVTLDLNGFAVTGVPGSLDGIVISGVRRNVSVRNGVVADWGGSGVDLSGGSQCRVSDLSVSGNGAHGIVLGTLSVLHDVSSTGNTLSAIRLSGDGNRLDGCHATQCGVGMDVVGVGNLIVCCSAWDNGNDYLIGAGNAYGPIAIVGGVGDISAVPSADHPWANFSLACTPQLWCADVDGDGFGDAGDTQMACEAPFGYVADCTDCDDLNAAKYPGGTEVCDGLDNNCNGQIDDGAGTTWCRDGDSDGYGDPISYVVSCSPPLGFVADCTDCDDRDALLNWSDVDGDGFWSCEDDCDDSDGTVFPGAPEICDGKDNDCNPGTPDGAQDPDLGTACDGADADACLEGAMQCTAGTLACSDLTGNNVEVCDGVDNDCDPGTPDGAQDPALGTACDGADADACLEGAFECSGGALMCNDVTGDSIEVCDGLDNDCDGTVDDGLSPPLCPLQLGVCNGSTKTCGGASGWLPCNSSNYGPDYEVPELSCDGLDNDCNGQTDVGRCPTGTPCASHSVCTSSVCADGFCCNRSCFGPCEMCDWPGAEGGCITVPHGQDPDDDCPGSDFCISGGQCCFQSNRTCNSNSQCCSGNCIARPLISDICE